MSGVGTRAPTRPRLNSAAIRRINTAHVFHALREAPGISQRQIVATTGLDAATVSSIVTRLEAEGHVRRAPGRRSGQAGRPERALVIDADAGWLVGAGIEPGNISLIAAGLDGKPRGRLEMTAGTDMEAVTAALRDGVRQLLAECRAEPGRVHGIGIGIPGLIDARGHLVLAPNLGWRNLQLASLLRDAFDEPVHVDNDTKAAAKAEHLFGACRGIADFIFVYGNAGIGGGLHLGGRLYRGFDGLAGELGHMKIIPDGRACGCGARGCFEAYVSARAISARLQEAGRSLPDATAVARAAQAGDDVVRGVLDEAGAHLGLALANLVNIVNPRTLVLGGNLAVLADDLLPAARRALAVNGLPVMLEDAEILVSPLGAEAVPMGGVALAMEGFMPTPDGLARPI
jgi:predicted NBD/HSP70 family sugar kinase